MIKQLDRFKEELISRGASQNTVGAYLADIGEFLKSTPPKRITRTHVKEYMIDLSQRKLAESTRARKLSSLKTFFAFLVEEEIITADPTVGIRRPKQGTRLPEWVDEAGLKKIVKVAKNDREHLLVLLLAGCGLRLSEALNLKQEDVGDTYIMVRSAKGKKDRAIPIGEKIKKALEETLLPLGFSIITARRVIYRLTEEALGKRHSPHTLRHSFASIGYKKTQNIEAIRKMLGHTSLTTTQIYTHVSDKDMEEVAKAVTW